MQNSTVGAINYIAAKPTEEFRAGASLTYGRFNTIEGEAYIRAVSTHSGSYPHELK